MLRYLRCVRRRSRPVTTILVAALGALAMLVPLTITGEGVASATPAEGYIATRIPLGSTEESTVAVNSATNTVYLGSAVGDETNEITVLNGTNDTVTTSIALAGPPQGIAVDPVTGTVYVSVDASQPAVDVIDGATNAVTATIPLPSGLASNAGIAVDSATDLVYVAMYYASEVVVINGATNTLSATVNTGLNTNPEGLAVDATSDVVWVANEFGSVIAISGTSDTVTQTVSFSGDSVWDVDVDPATDTVYAAVQSNSSYIAVIDGSTGAISATISLTETFQSVAVDSVTDTVFASSIYGSSPVDSPGTTWVIDGSSNTITDTIPRGGNQVAVSTSSGSAYVAPAAAQIDAAWALAPSTANALSPIITGASGNALTVGTAGSITINSSALPAATYSETGTLPSGVTLSSSGILSGTPAAGTGGAYPVTLTASNGVAPDFSVQFNLNIDEAPAITSADQASFVAGVLSFFAVTASGYPESSFSETGVLPSGVTLQSSGDLTGTPAAGTAGIYRITITASNGVGTVTQTFTLTVTTPPPAASAAVGAEGGNGQLYVQAPQLAAGWQPLGGQIEGAPAVAAAPNADGTTPADPVFIAAGSNGELWMRTLTLGWQPVGPSEAFCIGSPAAVASNGMLTVACEGLNRQLYYNTTIMTGAGLPSFTSAWTSLGGILSAGPAVALVGGTVTFFAEGTNGQVFINTGSGYTTTQWFCIGTLAAATQATTGTTTFGCQGQGDHSLWMATNDGTVWSAAVSVGGQLSGGPGIAATSQQVEFFAEGTDGTGWEWTPSGGWASIGGIITGGTGATALN